MESPQLGQYLPVLMLGLLALLFTGGMLAGSALLGVRGRGNPAKDTPWECGMKPEGVGPARPSVRFYRVAMLFVLFDVAVVFLYPWAVVYGALLEQPQTQSSVFFGMAGFLAVLAVGYFYALKQGALDWKD